MTNHTRSKLAMTKDAASKRRLWNLIQFANGKDVPLSLLVGDDIMFTIPYLQGLHERELRNEAKRLLASIAEDDSTGIAVLEAVVNSYGLRVSLESKGYGRMVLADGRILRGDEEGPARLVYSISNWVQLPYVLLAIGRTIATGAGDTWVDRVSRCQECEQFYLLPSRKTSRFCGGRCRRLNSGRGKNE